VSFFGGIGFGRVGEPEWTTDRNPLVASLDDPMATKLKVVLQRVEARDHRGVAAMVTSGVSLAKGLASARRLCGNMFQPGEALKALVYFEGGDRRGLLDSERRALVDAVAAVRELPDESIAATSLAGTSRRSAGTPPNG
jgi:hypothetical protein